MTRTYVTAEDRRTAATQHLLSALCDVDIDDERSLEYAITLLRRLFAVYRAVEPTTRRVRLYTRKIDV